MELHPYTVLALARLRHQPDAELVDALLVGRERFLGNLHDDHVASVAATTLEVTASRRVVLPRLGRHGFQELVAEGDEEVVQPVAAHAGVAVADFHAEDGLAELLDAVEVMGYQADLADADVRHRVAPLGGAGWKLHVGC